MSDLPLVSVATPSFDQARFLEETILSVLNQEYPRVEYIIIDGGSTDGSVEIIRKYADRLAHWISEPDGGQADAINKGWRLSHGDIVAYLNSDDTYVPGAISAALECFQSHPDVDILYGDAQIIDASGALIGHYAGGPFDFHEMVRNCHNVIPQPSTFFRRRVLEKAGAFDIRLQFVFDFEYWLRAGQRCQFLYVPQVFSSVRIQPDSKSSTIKLVGASEAVQVYERFFSNPDLDRALKAIQNEAMANVYALAGQYAYAAASPKETHAYLQETFRRSPRSIVNLELLGKYLVSMLGPAAMRFSRNFAQQLSGRPVW